MNEKSLFSSIVKKIPTPDFLSEPIDVLIAGCGTGQEAIELALQNPHYRITAIDISQKSLAYAARMAQQYKVSSVEFVHLDLLHCAALGKHFDFIESMGVLHHLPDPAAGSPLCAPS